MITIIRKNHFSSLKTRDLKSYCEDIQLFQSESFLIIVFIRQIKRCYHTKYFVYKCFQKLVCLNWVIQIGYDASLNKPAQLHAAFAIYFYIIILSSNSSGHPNVDARLKYFCIGFQFSIRFSIRLRKLTQQNT